MLPFPSLVTLISCRLINKGRHQVYCPEFNTMLCIHTHTHSCVPVSHLPADSFWCKNIYSNQNNLNITFILSSTMENNKIKLPGQQSWLCSVFKSWLFQLAWFCCLWCAQTQPVSLFSNWFRKKTSSSEMTTGLFHHPKNRNQGVVMVDPCWIITISNVLRMWVE